MPVPLNDRLTGPYVATGGETVLVYDFPVLSGADLAVRRRRDGVEALLALTTDYIVDGVGSLSGGNVVLADAALAGDEYVVEGARPAARIADFAGEQALKAQALNAELDSLQMQIAELRRQMDMAVKRSRFDIETVSLDLPPWDGEGPRAVVIGADGKADLVAYETIGEGPATWAIPVDWETGLACTVGPPSTVVSYDAGSGAELYVCVESHTAGATFAGDAAKWRRVAGDPPAAFDIDALGVAGAVDRDADRLAISQGGVEKKIAPSVLIPAARMPGALQPARSFTGTPGDPFTEGDELTLWGTQTGVVTRSSGTVNTARLYLAPMHPGRRCSLTHLGCFPSATSVYSARLGVYSCHANGLPDALVAATGEIALSSSGVKVEELASAVDLDDAPYWLACIVSGACSMWRVTATATAFGLLNGQYLALGLYDEMSYGPLPSSQPDSFGVEGASNYLVETTAVPLLLWLAT